MTQEPTGQMNDLLSTVIRQPLPTESLLDVIGVEGPNSPCIKGPPSDLRLCLNVAVALPLVWGQPSERGRPRKWLLDPETRPPSLFVLTLHGHAPAVAKTRGKHQRPDRQRNISARHALG